MYQALTAIFPVASEWLALQLDGEQTISALTTTLDLRLVCWEKKQGCRTVNAIYVQKIQLLPEDFGLPLAGGLRVENYLLALGLTLEKVFKLYDERVLHQHPSYARGLLATLASGFGNNHPLLLAKAQTVEDFVKALETKGRLGRWL